MLSQEGKKNRLIAIESLIQFIECAIHAFLLSRCIYPASSFRCHMRFGIAVWLCDSKSVKLYVRQICSPLQNLFLHDRVQAIVVATNSERFTIELPNEFAKCVLSALPAGTARTELEIRSFCANALRDALIQLDRKLGKKSCSETQNCDWDVFVDVKNRANSQISDTIDMPSGWLIETTGPESVSVRNPIKSVSIGDNVVLSTYTDA